MGRGECQEPGGGGADHLCLARRRKLPREGLLQGDARQVGGVCGAENSRSKGSEVGK